MPSYLHTMILSQQCHKTWAYC